MKYSFVAAALVGSVLATQHNGHAGFHARRGGYEAKEEVCTVYTTVYATAPLPTMVANSTVAYPHGAPSVSTSCSEEVETPIYTPVVLSSTHEAPVPSKEAYPPAPVPASSTSCADEETPAPTPAVPVVSKEAYPPAPVPSAEAYPPAPQPEAPQPEAPKPEAPKPEAPKPEAPKPEAPKPEAPKPEAPKPEAPKPEAPKPEAPKPEAPKPETPKPEAPKPAPVSSVVADKPKPTGGYSSGGRIKTNGDKWAITYTPYANSGDCKTQDEIKDDIKKISELGFTTIRSYSTDCGVFEFVVPECQKYGLKVIYGIFLEGAGKGPFSEYANAQLEDIKEKAPKDGVAMIIVGNECMFNNNCEANQLASYIDHVRKELHDCGFPKDIAVTTTEPVGTWEEKGAALCDHIDVFTVQVHPFFTQSITAEQAGDFAAQQLEQAAKVCPGAAEKGTYITEIGWPSAGQSNGQAVAGAAEQKIAMKKIIEKVGSHSCLFSFQDDGWKHPGPHNVEQHFGIMDALY